MSGLQAVRVIGGIVPPSMLARVQGGEVAAESLTPASYRLAGNETLRDAAARAWAYLQGAWAAFRDIETPTIAQTRERWLLPLVRELGYGNVPALPHGLSIDETHYPISHRYEEIPIHLLAPAIHLDRRNPGVAGAARAPQAMLQEFLNRSDEHLWALLSNGTRLRMLRDSTALAGSAYLEFDLEGIFDGELYSEFLLMFLLAHSTRTEKRGEDAGPADCWLEAWRNDAVDTGTRALDKLRIGVERAITDLGDGFLHHPSNGWLVEALRTGQLSDRDYLRALLRLIYRLLFCFVAEDRGALLDPHASPEAKDRYATYFSTARLRRVSRIRAGGPHPDLWEAQRLVLAALGGQGLPQIGIPPLGGLFDPDPRATPVEHQPEPDLLLGADLSNHALLAAIRALAWVQVAGGRTQPVDYRNLGAEELGSVYESLLELIPRVDLTDMTFRLETVAGHDRKTTGSYYTPPALVSALLDTALDPLLDEAVKNADNPEHAEQRLLGLTVCDPASGSGGFLVAAARRIARRLAQVRSGEDEPTPEQVHHALRDVVGTCIYGVDINDLAAELAKVSLWLEALEPGKPLGFLDARIRVGNSLIGTTPVLLTEGVPDAAFKEISGDDKKYAAAVRKQNKIERSGQSSLFASDGTLSTTTLAAARRQILQTTDDITTTRERAAQWEEFEESDAVRTSRLHADAWTAAFVWPLEPGATTPVTQEVLLSIAANPDNPALADMVAEVQRLA
ncbi:MAG: N-6 DNA methylase, partial [Actinobacteria bacterium]|nr:N-6 DNA methylase [Actinomycetota bacterium]